MKKESTKATWAFAAVAFALGIGIFVFGGDLGSQGGRYNLPLWVLGAIGIFAGVALTITAVRRKR